MQAISMPHWSLLAPCLPPPTRHSPALHLPRRHQRLEGMCLWVATIQRARPGRQGCGCHCVGLLMGLICKMADGAGGGGVRADVTAWVLVVDLICKTGGGEQQRKQMCIHHRALIVLLGLGQRPARPPGTYPPASGARHRCAAAWRPLPAAAAGQLPSWPPAGTASASRPPAASPACEHMNSQ